MARRRLPGPLGDLATVLMPARCPGCGTVANPICRRCAAGVVLPRPLPAPTPLRRWYVAFSYEGPVRELIARTKYRNERHATAWLAERLVETIGEASVEFDLVTHVPATRAHRREHGFDHGALLARAVASGIGRPHAHVLRRARGPAQTGRSAAQRRIGPSLRVVGAVRDQRVLLVDDVATTGSSLRAAGRVLVHAGARQPDAAVVARTPGRLRQES